MKTISSLDDAINAGLVSPEDRATLAPICEKFSIQISEPILQKIDLTRKNDPLFLQMVPDPRESIDLESDLIDPIGDLAHEPIPRLIHRYRDRALLLVTDRCPCLCRFCFRKLSPIHGEEPPFDLEKIVEYIQKTPDITEAVLSGGDPLMLSNEKLAQILDALEAIPNIERLRIHTRIPITLPARIDAHLLKVLCRKKALTIAIHINHNRELDQATKDAIKALDSTGATLVSQTVLLKNINDDPTVLKNLCYSLGAIRVRPYYLHHPDLVTGTSHFRVSIAEGLTIYRTLRSLVPPLLLPIYTLDLPGGYGKTPIDSGCMKEIGNGEYEFTTPLGYKRIYKDPAAK